MVQEDFPDRKKEEVRSCVAKMLAILKKLYGSQKKGLYLGLCAFSEIVHRLKKNL